MDAHPYQERLLRLMERKDHWAWPAFTRPGLSRAQLRLHFANEYQTYVKDFPVLLARVLAHGPPAAARKALAENIYEEQTGKLSFGLSHPELFLEMMAGIGFSEAELEDRAAFLPEARAYRSLLDAAAAAEPWLVGAAVLTLFVEGSRFEREELAGTRALLPVEEAIRAHPLVVHYGCPPEKMRLVGAHRLVERGHRRDAWQMVLSALPPSGPVADSVERAVASALDGWLRYRDAVAERLGLPRGTA